MRTSLAETDKSTMWVENESKLHIPIVISSEKIQQLFCLIVDCHDKFESLIFPRLFYGCLHIIKKLFSHFIRQRDKMQKTASDDIARRFRGIYRIYPPRF
jgi:hypothetical protein